MTTPGRPDVTSETRLLSGLALLLALSALPLRGQQVDSLAVGEGPLHDGELAVGSDTMHAFMVRDSVQIPLGTLVETISRTTVDGREAYLIVEKKDLPPGLLVDSLTVLAGSLAPVRHRSREESGQTATATYRGRRIVTERQPSGAPGERRELRLERRVYDVAQVRTLVRHLPLETDYRARIPTYDPWGRDRITWVEVRVAGTAAVKHRGEAVPCWKVEARLGTGWSAVYYVAKASRQELRLDIRNLPGGARWIAIRTEGDRSGHDP